MKIIFLNAFYGEFQKPLTEFINEHKSSTDVFCFQESHDKINEICRLSLNDFVSTRTEKHNNNEEKFAQASYINNKIEVIATGSLLGDRNDLGLGQFVKLKINNKLTNIGNIHGLPKPGHKLDTKERIDQSKILIEFFKNVDGIKIIGGDFNVSPEASCVRMFEDNGYIDLIKKYNIKTTRNEIALANYPNSIKYYSDYVFISPEVKVKRFEVPDMDISDHLPMILEIED